MSKLKAPILQGGITMNQMTGYCKVSHYRSEGVRDAVEAHLRRYGHESFQIQEDSILFDMRYGKSPNHHVSLYEITGVGLEDLLQSEPYPEHRLGCVIQQGQTIIHDLGYGWRSSKQQYIELTVIGGLRVSDISTVKIAVNEAHEVAIIVEPDQRYQVQIGSACDECDGQRYVETESTRKECEACDGTGRILPQGEDQD